MVFKPLSVAPLCALSLRGGFLVVPCFGYMSASMALAPGLRLSLVPYPRFFRMGFVPLSEAPLSALQLPALPLLVVLGEAAGLRGFLDLSLVLT